MMKMVVAKSSFITDSPERRIGEENLLLTDGNQIKVMITVIKHIKRDR
jgi:hypothetical protein